MKKFKNAMDIKKKYFLNKEFWETIGKVKFMMKAPLVKKEHVYRKIGSRYYGQFLGGFRHG